MTRIHHAAYDLRSAQVAKVLDALEGEEQIERQGQLYLPRPSAMSADDYEAYLKRAHYFPVAERTLRGLSGIALSHDPQVTLPKALTPLIENATFKGHALDVLIETVLNEVLSVGHIALLLDFPATGNTALSTPYVSMFKAQTIYDYREEVVDGRSRLVMVRLCEDEFDDFDDDGRDVERHLVLTLVDGIYTMQRFEVDGKELVPITDPVVPLVNGAPLTEIPIVFVSPYDLGAEPPKPPFLDLVNVSLSHYRNSADLEHALFLTSQPTPWVSGNLNEDQKPSALGSGAFWVLPEGAQAGMLEMQGHGIQHLREVMGTKKDEMAALGARMIHEGLNRNESAQTAKMRGRAEMSLLQGAVRMTEAAMRRLLRWAALWTTANPDEVVFEMSRDFVSVEMSGQDVVALVKAWQSGAISHMTLIENLQRGEIIPADRSVDHERMLIESEAPDLGADLPSKGA